MGKQDKQSKKRTDASRRWRKAWRLIQPYAAKNRGCLAIGFVAALAAIGLRLSLPWLLTNAIKPAITSLQGDAAAPSSSVWLFPPVQFSALILGIFVLWGWTDFLQRLYFARFVIRTVRGLRADIMRKVLGSEPSAIPRGDLVARVVGDTARLKAGMNGFLIHIFVNLLLVLGITVILAWANLGLGLIVACGGTLIFIVTVYGAKAVYRRSIKNRNKEGQIGNLLTASNVEDADEELIEKVNRSSGKHEGRVTALQGYTTWAVYVIFGLIVAGGLLLALNQVASHRMDGSVALLFVLYAMQLRTPLVHMSRQGAGTGKIVACCERLAELL